MSSVFVTITVLEVKENSHFTVSLEYSPGMDLRMVEAILRGAYFSLKEAGESQDSGAAS